jgi:hypothetical protein
MITRKSYATILLIGVALLAGVPALIQTRAGPIEPGAIEILDADTVTAAAAKPAAWCAVTSNRRSFCSPQCFAPSALARRPDWRTGLGDAQEVRLNCLKVNARPTHKATAELEHYKQLTL